ncbi:MAG TPA: class A beta-lactamase [Candidatus Eisenbacteria bacterium]|nr:class A beta-lactamase [Candidatus Eisenbacteria bacterium]
MKRALGFVAVATVVIVAGLTLRPAPRTTPPDIRPSPATPSLGARHPEHPDTALEARLRTMVSGMPARCGVVAKNLANGAVARVNADTLIPLLSVVKLAVAVVIMDGVDRGQWSLSTPITLLPQDMHPRGWLGDRYPRGGGPVSLYRLLDVMLTRSDNTSADALMRIAGGPVAVTRWLEGKGIRDFRVDRTERALGNDWHGVAPGADTLGSAEEIREIRSRVPVAVHDSAARAMLLDPRDTGTAEACVHLLERLWSGGLLSAAMTDTLKSILARCKTAPHRLPAMLPKGTRVARKTGTGGTSAGVTVAINDVGVMRLPNGDEVAIAVLVGEPRGSIRRAERLIARTARTVFDAWSAK